jgi:hypothetical protein
MAYVMPKSPLQILSKIRATVGLAQTEQLSRYMLMDITTHTDGDARQTSH